MVAWSTRHLADELRAPGMLLALDAIWRDVDAPAVWSTNPPRRLVFVDEAWTLLRDGQGAKFLSRLAKSARKRRAEVAVITQDVGDLLGSDLGQVVIANAATQILFRQAPQAIDVVADVFGLTAGEARLLLGARRGEALLLSGTHRVKLPRRGLQEGTPALHRFPGVGPNLERSCRELWGGLIAECLMWSP
jgi:DNA helicase HerA-like ATPase